MSILTQQPKNHQTCNRGNGIVMNSSKQAEEIRMKTRQRRKSQKRRKRGGESERGQLSVHRKKAQTKPIIQAKCNEPINVNRSSEPAPTFVSNCTQLSIPNVLGYHHLKWKQKEQERKLREKKTINTTNQPETRARESRAENASNSPQTQREECQNWVTLSIC